MKDIDFDFDNVDDIDDTYESSETFKQEPLVKEFEESSSKEDLDPILSMVIQLMKAALEDSNAKGVYPDKVVAQALQLMKEHKVQLTTKQADEMSKMLQQFRMGDRNSAKIRNTAALNKEAIN